MSQSENKNEILAQLRTLFALERNFLAEQRTQLALFRTGMAMVVFVPSFYFFSLSVRIRLNPLITGLFYLFLVGVAAAGTWMLAKAYFKIKTIRKKIMFIKFREKKIIDSNEAIANMLSMAFFVPENDVEQQYKALKKRNKTRQTK